MIKKIILGTLFIGLVGLLIFGAVNRTIAKNEGPVARGLGGEKEVTSTIINEDAETFEGNGYGRGNSQGRTSQTENNEYGECSNQGGNGTGRNSQVPGTGSGQGLGGQGRYSNRDDYSLEDHADTALMTIDGTVETITPEAAIIKIAEGQEVIIDGRAWRFAQEMGYSLQIGQTVSITGFEEDGEFKPVEIFANGSDSAFQFRDNNGRPSWAGQGQGKGRNQSGLDI